MNNREVMQEAFETFMANDDKFPDGCNMTERVFNAGYQAALASQAQQEPSNELKEMEARKDAAYLERNQVVAALAKCFPSGIAKTAIEGWSEDWHGCVYIDFPTGQASWHYHDSQTYLFADLPAYKGNWDGHTTDEKYSRIAKLQSQAQQPSEEFKAAALQELYNFQEGTGCDVAAELKPHQLSQAQQEPSIEDVQRLVEASEIMLKWCVKNVNQWNFSEYDWLHHATEKVKASLPPAPVSENEQPNERSEKPEGEKK